MGSISKPMKLSQVHSSLSPFSSISNPTMKGVIRSQIHSKASTLQKKTSPFQSLSLSSSLKQPKTVSSIPSETSGLKDHSIVPATIEKPRENLKIQRKLNKENIPTFSTKANQREIEEGQKLINSLMNETPMTPITAIILARHDKYELMISIMNREKRKQVKYTFNLLDGIIQYNHQEYLFGKSICNIMFISIVYSIKNKQGIKIKALLFPYINTLIVVIMIIYEYSHHQSL